MPFTIINDPLAKKKVVEYIRARGWIRNFDCRRLLGIGYDEATALFNAMLRSGEIVRVGKKGGTKYVLPVSGMDGTPSPK